MRRGRSVPVGVSPPLGPACRAAVFAAAALSLACGGGDRRRSAIEVSAGGDTTGAAQAVAASQPTYVNRDGGIVITTVDGGVELGLVHDTVSMGLADSVLAQVRSDIQRDSAKGGRDSSPLGGALSHLITKTVTSALRTRIDYPVRDITGATYQDGAIHFTYRNEHHFSFEDVSTAHRKALQDFNPEDARRFVAAVDSAIGVQHP